jgi:hypothetical protein
MREVCSHCHCSIAAHDVYALYACGPVCSACLLRPAARVSDCAALRPAPHPAPARECRRADSLTPEEYARALQHS